MKINTNSTIQRVARLPIKLGQFMKLAELCQDGLECKLYITNGEVKVNGEVETRRGRQLRAGDTVEFRKQRFTVQHDGI